MFNSILKRSQTLRNFYLPWLLLCTLTLPTAVQALQSNDDVSSLGPGKRVERELTGGQSHSYRITLNVGQYLSVVVDQRGINVIVTLFGPDGKQIVEVDSPIGKQGSEPIFAIAEVAGDYRLEVRSPKETVTAGRYEVRIEELRTGTKDDRKQIDAEKAFMEAELLREEATAENFHSAKKKYEEALAFYPSGKPGREALVLHSLGGVHYMMGERQEALSYFNQALYLFRLAGDLRGEGDTLNSLGVVYDDLGEKQKALEYYNKSLPLRQATKDHNGEATVLSNIGIVYNSLGEVKKALEYFERALPLYRAVDDLDGQATTLNNIGMAHYNLKDKNKALDYFHQALAARGKAGVLSGLAVQLSNIGSLHYSFGDLQAALYYYLQALPLRRAIGDLSGEGVTRNNLMHLYTSLNQPRVAIFHGKQAVNVYQQLRSNIQDLDREVQRTYLQTVEQTYRGLAELLIKQKRLAEAQQVLNAFKDQQFFDLDEGQIRQLKPLVLTPREDDFVIRFNKAADNVGAVTVKVTEFRRAVNSGQQRDAEASQQQFEAKLKPVADEFSDLIKQIETVFSQATGAEDQVGEVLETIEMQAALRQLSRETGQKAVAIYSLVGREVFHALIITDNDITSVSNPVQQDQLNHIARQLWAMLQSPEHDPRTLSNELYSIIFKPIEDKLPKDTQTLFWSLDGNLRYVPMAALYDGKQYLVERYNHVVFTRSDRERMVRAVTRNWTATGLGTSAAHTVELLGNKITFGSLPGVREELRLLFKRRDNPRGIFDGETLQDAKFTKTGMLTALKEKRPLVHIASHFAFRPGDAERSFLLLGDGTALTLAEMKQQAGLFEGVEMLTLSACNTGAQQIGANGREIDAFAELAQRLGAKSVMATLWPVADSSTPWLMHEFYQTRQQQALNKAEALRLAQLALLNGRARPSPAKAKRVPEVQVITTGADQRSTANTRADIIFVDEKNALPFSKDPRRPFAHPYYWSPFILIGNGR